MISLNNIGEITSFKIRGKLYTQETKHVVQWLRNIGWTDNDIEYSGLGELGDQEFLSIVTAEGYEYALDLYESGVTSFNFYNDKSLTILPKFSTTYSDISFSDCTNLKYIPEYILTVSDPEDLFYNCYNLVSVNVNGWTISGDSLENSFYNCREWDFDGVETWNVSGVTNFHSTFELAKTDSLDLSGWNLSAGEDFQKMFKNSNIGSLKIILKSNSSTDNFEQMFYGAQFTTIDITGSIFGSDEVECSEIYGSANGYIADVDAFGYTNTEYRENLPSGYTQLNYIQKTGSTIVNTGYTLTTTSTTLIAAIDLNTGTDTTLTNVGTVSGTNITGLYYSGGVVNSSNTVSIYYVKFYQGDTLLRDYIPAINASGDYGLYDFVSQSFFIISGATGDTSVTPRIDRPVCLRTNNGVVSLSDEKRLPAAYQEIEYVQANDNEIGVSGYQCVEYIQSTGYEYVDTGIKANNIYKIEAYFAQVSGTQEQSLFGARDDSGSENACTDITTSQGGLYNRWHKNQNITQSTSIQLGTNYKVEIQSGSFKVNDTSYPLNEGTLAGPTTNLYIFRRNSTYTAYTCCKLYYFKIWGDSTTLVRDFIPAMRLSDGVLGLYDKISGSFFTNASASGNFIGGSKINNTPFIELPLNGDQKFEIDAQMYNSTSTDAILLSCGDSNESAFVGKKQTFNGWFFCSNISSYSSISRSKMYLEFNETDGNTLRISAYTLGPVIGGELDENYYLFDNMSRNTPAIGAKVYSVRSYDSSGELSMELIPAKRISDGVIGFYDTINEIFYNSTNQNLEFTAGDDVHNWTLVGDTQEVITDSENHKVYPEILFKLGSYSDVQYMAKGYIDRVTYYHVFDGSETFTYTNNTFIYSANTIPKNTTDTICTHYIKGASTLTNEYQISLSGDISFNDCDVFTSVTQFKNFLKNQLEEGTPMIVLFARSQNITEQTDAQTTLTYSPITVTGGASGLQTTIEYGNDNLSTFKTKNISITDSIRSNQTALSQFLIQAVNCTPIRDLDLSGFNAGTAEAMSQLFKGATKLQTFTAHNVQMPNITALDRIFEYDEELTSVEVDGTLQDVNTYNIEAVFNTTGTGKLEDISFYDTETSMPVNDMSALFANQIKLKEIEATLDVGDCSNFQEAFRNCESLEWVGFKGWTYGDIDFGYSPSLTEETIYELVSDSQGNNSKSLTLYDYNVFIKALDKYPTLENLISTYNITIVIKN